MAKRATGKKSKARQGSVVDGFTTMKAAQRASVDKIGATSPPVAAPQPKAQSRVSGQARIVHTARPSKHDIICYECGYEWVITGLLNNVYCPKCRSILETGELVIDREWGSIIRTIGTVTITDKGFINGGRIVANTVQLAGKIEGGQVEIHGKLVIQGHGTYKPAAVQARDLEIDKEAKSSFVRTLEVRNLAIFGRIKASIRAEGIVTVHSGGLLEGEIEGPHLIVEEGGGLNAKISVTLGADDEESASET